MICFCLFKVFDENKSGDLDFVEYMMAVNSTQLETAEDKLLWIFKMYDKVRMDLLLILRELDS